MVTTKRGEDVARTSGAGRPSALPIIGSQERVNAMTSAVVRVVSCCLRAARGAVPRAGALRGSAHWASVRLARVAIVALALAALPARAAVTYRASGTFTNSTTTCTAPMPAGVVANDILLLVVESENQAISLTTANGFVEVTNSPQSAGTAATDPANRIAVWFR